MGTAVQAKVVIIASASAGQIVQGTPTLFDEMFPGRRRPSKHLTLVTSRRDSPVS